MKHINNLLNEQKRPIPQIMDLSKDVQNKMIAACLRDLFEEKSARIFNVILEAYNCDALTATCSAFSLSSDVLTPSWYEPNIDYDSLYLPLEHIINSEIDLYNNS